jgi:hypothetical protein
MPTCRKNAINAGFASKDIIITKPAALTTKKQKITLLLQPWPGPLWVHKQTFSLLFQVRRERRKKRPESFQPNVFSGMFSGSDALCSDLEPIPIAKLHIKLDGIVAHFAFVVDLDVIAVEIADDSKGDLIALDFAVFDRRIAAGADYLSSEIGAVHLEFKGTCARSSVGSGVIRFPFSGDIGSQAKACEGEYQG